MANDVYFIVCENLCISVYRLRMTSYPAIDYVSLRNSACGLGVGIAYFLKSLNPLKPLLVNGPLSKFLQTPAAFHLISSISSPHTNRI